MRSMKSFVGRLSIGVFGAGVSLTSGEVRAEGPANEPAPRIDVPTIATAPEASSAAPPGEAPGEVGRPRGLQMSAEPQGPDWMGPQTSTMGAAGRPYEQELPDEFFDRKGRLRRRVTPIDGWAEPPPPYEWGTRSRRALWGPGIGILGGAYLASTLTGSLGYLFSVSCSDFTCSAEPAWLYGAIPVVGGFIAAGDGDVEAGGKVAFVVLGVAQLTGLGLLIGGLASTEDTWVLSRGGYGQIKIDAGLGGLSLSGTY